MSSARTSQPGASQSSRFPTADGWPALQLTLVAAETNGDASRRTTNYGWRFPLRFFEARAIESCADMKPAITGLVNLGRPVITPFRGRWRWLFVAVLPVIAFASFSYTNSLHKKADQAMREQILFVNLDGKLVADGIFQRAIADNPRILVRQLPQLEQIGNDLSQIVNQLSKFSSGNEPGDAIERSLPGLYRQLVNAGTQEFFAILSKHPDDISQRSAELKKRLDALSYAATVGAMQQGRVAKAAERRATRGALFSYLIATLALMLVFWRFFRARRITGIAVARESALKESERRFRDMAQNASDLITSVDLDLSIRYQSDSAQRLLGRKASEMEGTNFSALVSPSDLVLLLAACVETSRGREVGPIDARLLRADGGWMQGEVLVALGNQDDHLVLTTRDVSARKKYEDDLRYRTLHDPLTDLPNSTLFEQQLKRALAVAWESRCKLAVLFLSLDNFQGVVDSLGHRAGDELIVEAAHELRSCLEPDCALARFGTNEFAVLIPEVASDDEAVTIAARLRDRMLPPIEVRGKQVVASMSVGVAVGGVLSGASAEELIHSADLAMSAAKVRGNGHPRLFSIEMYDAACERLELIADLHKAVEREEFVVHYQPMVDISDGAIVGFEALVRWQHPERGMVPPLSFIGLAEESGLIDQIGMIVLRTATRQTKQWQSEFPLNRKLGISVNIAPQSVRPGSFVADVARVLGETGLDAATLILEITESAVGGAYGDMTASLSELKQLGVMIAVDDFGTGYSALAHLSRFPVDIIKIDKSFVDMVVDGEGSQLVSGIINLAHGMGMATVAEGIESAQQAEILRAANVGVAQGFHFARPMPAEDAVKLLSEQVQSDTVRKFPRSVVDRGPNDPRATESAG